MTMSITCDDNTCVVLTTNIRHMPPAMSHCLGLENIHLLRPTKAAPRLLGGKFPDGSSFQTSWCGFVSV